MTMNEERYLEFAPIAKRVARRVSGEYHMVEAADLEQELMMFVLSRGDEFPSPSEATFSMQSFLTRVARQYAFGQKQQHYLVDPNLCYEVSDIREIFTTHFDKSMWDSVLEDQSVEDTIAAHSDVAWALDRLLPAEKEFIAGCYTSDNGLPKSGTPEYTKLRNLTIKVANQCNHYTRADEGNGPGRRKAISNSTARALLDDSMVTSNNR